jgi:hypothetical protein
VRNLQANICENKIKILIKFTPTKDNQSKIHWFSQENKLLKAKNPLMNQIKESFIKWVVKKYLWRIKSYNSIRLKKYSLILSRWKEKCQKFYKNKQNIQDLKVKARMMKEVHMKILFIGNF